MKILIKYNFFCFFLILFGCSEENNKDIRFFEIADYDNYITNHDKQIDYINSMLEKYPQSEYFHGMKIMMLANQGYKDSAINYNNVIAAKHPMLYGTFMCMGVAQAIMVYQFDNKWKSSDHNFLESIALDKAKVNIWARIGVYLVNKDSGNFEKAEKYLLEAHEINEKNAYVLDELTRFYIQLGNYQRAQFFFKQINRLYFPREMKFLKSELDSLMKNRPLPEQQEESNIYNI